MKIVDLLFDVWPVFFLFINKFMIIYKYTTAKKYIGKISFPWAIASFYSKNHKIIKTNKQSLIKNRELWKQFSGGKISCLNFWTLYYFCILYGLGINAIPIKKLTHYQGRNREIFQGGGQSHFSRYFPPSLFNFFQFFLIFLIFIFLFSSTFPIFYLFSLPPFSQFVAKNFPVESLGGDPAPLPPPVMPLHIMSNI